MFLFKTFPYLDPRSEIFFVPRTESGGKAITLHDQNGQSRQEGFTYTDLKVSEAIRLAWEKDEMDKGFIHGLMNAFDIFAGVHFGALEGSEGENAKWYTHKGVLDYLIFPLLARKLLVQARYEVEDDLWLRNCYFQFAAFPLQCLRFSLALALTILVSPIVALVHILRDLKETNNKGELLVQAVSPFAPFALVR